ncbi:Pectinesterase inhibitor [Melia azedarach]|uniref:Pectinesterase inhibitor n=1 Tax=Melia azedarach TaxID=155640 RepID=A0ACC1YDT2_MELAZ|nr:Pectinesterase inhibitor [Melia azedarach]
MASSKSSFLQASILLVVVLPFLLIVPSFARLNVKVNFDEINILCSKIKNPPFCEAVLKSTPGVDTADFPGLIKITIDLARSNATNTQNLIKSLVPKATEPRLKASYTSCSDHYDRALGDFGDGEQALNANDPNRLSSYTSAAWNETIYCENELQGLAPDPSLPKGCQDLQSFCAIILVVANLLPR